MIGGSLQLEFCMIHDLPQSLTMISKEISACIES
jgi:hypothetical protein